MINLFSLNRAESTKKARIAAALTFVAANRISTIPSMLSKINQLARNESASAEDYASLCEMDQSSCVKILMLANSAAHGAHTGEVIRNVKQAVIRLGIRKTREVITSSVVSPFFKSGRSFNDYSPNALWLNSVAVAVANRLLYQLTSREEPADADPYLAGLLHNFAIPIEHVCFMEQGFQAAVNDRSVNQTLLAEEETKHIGINHNELGSALAEKWHFPSRITNIIKYHHHEEVPRAINDDPLLHITRASQWLCHEQHIGYAEFPESSSNLYLGSFNALQINADAYEAVSQQLNLEMQRLQKLGWFSGLRLNR